MWTVKKNPHVSIRVCHEIPYRADGAKIRYRSLNQSEVKTVETDQTPFGPNPEVSISRLTDCVNLSPYEPPLGSPLIVNVLRHCTSWIQGAGSVPKTNA